MSTAFQSNNMRDIKHVKTYLQQFVDVELYENMATCLATNVSNFHNGRKYNRVPRIDSPYVGGVLLKYLDDMEPTHLLDDVPSKCFAHALTPLVRAILEKTDPDPSIMHALCGIACATSDPALALELLRRADGRSWTHHLLSMNCILRGMTRVPEILDECERVANAFVMCNVTLHEGTPEQRLVAMYSIHCETACPEILVDDSMEIAHLLMHHANRLPSFDFLDDCVKAGEMCMEAACRRVCDATIRYHTWSPGDYQYGIRYRTLYCFERLRNGFVALHSAYRFGNRFIGGAEISYHRLQMKNHLYQQWSDPVEDIGSIIYKLHNHCIYDTQLERCLGKLPQVFFDGYYCLTKIGESTPSYIGGVLLRYLEKGKLDNELDISRHRFCPSALMPLVRCILETHGVPEDKKLLETICCIAYGTPDVKIALSLLRSLESTSDCVDFVIGCLLQHGDNDAVLEECE